VEHEPLLERNEVAAMLFNIADISTNVERILLLIEEFLDGEEEVPEEDA
jgi:lipoprotein signal peptidase